jgi:hypothetical protein
MVPACCGSTCFEQTLYGVNRFSNRNPRFCKVLHRITVRVSILATPAGKNSASDRNLIELLNTFSNSGKHFFIKSPLSTSLGTAIVWLATSRFFTKSKICKTMTALLPLSKPPYQMAAKPHTYARDSAPVAPRPVWKGQD